MLRAMSRMLLSDVRGLELLIWLGLRMELMIDLIKVIDGT